jgi:pimeloyl-ACP methyl ester carboxylesterase
VVAEAPYSSFREVAFDRLGQAFETGPWLGKTLFRPILWSGLLYGRWKYGVDLDAASPERALAGISVPLLLIHGSVDDNVPLRHCLTLRDGGPDRVLWEVPGAHHTAALETAPAEYEARVLAFFKKATR